MARLARFCGYGILVLCVVFLGQRFYQNFGDLVAVKPAPGFYSVLGIYCVGYGILQLLIVGALVAVLGGLGVQNPSFRHVTDLHGRSNIAKYLPGNVFHFVGRQVLAKTFGWPQAAVALASLVETALVALAAVIASLLFALAARDGALPAWSDVAAPGVVVAMIAAIAGTWMAGAYAGRIPLISRLGNVSLIEDFARGLRPFVALGLYSLFFIVNGAVFWALAATIKGAWSVEMMGLAGFAYVASWLAGYVTPGAPGGVGVREAALVFLLGAALGQAEALVLAISLRVVTTFGDLILFALALAVRRGGGPAAG